MQQITAIADDCRQVLEGAKHHAHVDVRLNELDESALSSLLMPMLPVHLLGTEERGARATGDEESMEGAARPGRAVGVARALCAQSAKKSHGLFDAHIISQKHHPPVHHQRRRSGGELLCAPLRALRSAYAREERENSGTGLWVATKLPTINQAERVCLPLRTDAALRGDHGQRAQSELRASSEGAQRELSPRRRSSASSQRA